MSKYPGRIVTDLAPAGYSVFFDGTGDYLQVADNAVFDLDTGDFTVEAWWYPTTISSTYQTIAGLWNSSGSNYGWILQVRSTDVLFSIGTGFFTVLGSTTITANRWYHVAATRSGTTIRVFLNGSLLNSGTSAASGTAVANLQIGRNEDGNQQYVNGYLSNVRIIKGTAVYTAAFTPPTQLFNITNTSLLTCNSPAIIDQSNNAFAITTNGDARVSTLTPFTAYVPYDPSMGAATPGVWTVDEAMQAAATRQWNMYDPSFNLTTLLLHGNGTNGAQNNTFLDSSSNNFTITRNPASGPNAPTQGSFSPFSQTGWSNYFGGDGNYLSVPYNAAFSFSTGDFSVECFANVEDAGRTADANKYGALVAFAAVAGNNDYWGITVRIVGGVISEVLFGNDTGDAIASGLSISLNQFHHFVACRTGTTLSIFVDGVRVATITKSSAINANTSGSLQVARSPYASGYQNWTKGYISNVRVVKGASAYSASSTTITVPTTPLIAISGTSLLTCQSNRFVDNSSNGFTLTPSGTPSVQAFSPFYPTRAYTPQTIGGSGFFDGTGDYLSNATAAVADFGTGDFTFECWFYLTALSTGSYYQIFSASNTAGAFQVYKTITSNDIVWDVNSVKTLAILSGSSLSANAWYHIAVVRSGSGSNNLKTYVNGAQTFQYTDSTNFTVTGAYVGAFATGVSNWPGYIAGLRILKGTALAPSGIPTTPPTAIANTSFLLNFTNAGVVDSTGDNVLETVGNAQISTTQSKFGGSSMYFDGTGDWLVAPANQNAAFGTGDFTVEAWVYVTTFTTTTGFQAIFSNRNLNSTQTSFDFGIRNSDRYLYFYNRNTDTSTFSTSGLSGVNTWIHVAIARIGSTITFYINGSSAGTVSVSTNSFGTSNVIYVGANFNTTPDTFNGYIDDLRITKGFARYTGNFTPQTSQWQDQ
jgi:hypothetical protein